MVPLYQVLPACGYSVIAKAMVMGKAVIATQTASHSDLIVDGEIGLFMNHLSSSDQNLALATSAEEVDRMNAEFYGRYPYPWPPIRLDRLLDGDFMRKMLCQAVGDWEHRVIPPEPEIWVAGCGTNQAVITALSFSNAKVVGSDLSLPSLDHSSRIAAELGIDNLDLRHETLNQVRYRDAFDYILCTGVIHHNADPVASLRQLSMALKPDGILELMVYNRFHRILTSAFQKVVRLLATTRPGATPGSSTEMDLASTLVNDFTLEGQMHAFLRHFQQARQEQFADALMQPVEYSYTVESLNDLATACGLEILSPAISIFDHANKSPAWNLRFRSTELNDCYYQLDDIRRWQVTNLLLAERSPMLWFYLKRADSGTPRRSEREICHNFLNTHFKRIQTKRQGYVLGNDGRYRPAGEATEYPIIPVESTLGKVINSVNTHAQMQEILELHALSTSFPEVNDIRLKLTSTTFPYLCAVDPAPPGSLNFSFDS